MVDNNRVISTQWSLIRTQWSIVVSIQYTSRAHSNIIWNLIANLLWLTSKHINLALLHFHVMYILICFVQVRLCFVPDISVAQIRSSPVTTCYPCTWFQQAEETHSGHQCTAIAPQVNLFYTRTKLVH